MNNIVIVRTVKFFAAVAAVLFAFGCYLPSKLKVPIDTVFYRAPGGSHNQLFIFLPGRGEDLSTFERHGIVQAVRNRGLGIDIITVDAYMSYYMNGSIITRLKNDIIEPAKAKGYKQIWLIGNSLGGFGSITYARQYPHDITGIVLLGPFLGEKKIVYEIREAGGLQKWNPGEIANNSEEGWEKQLWRWLKDREQQEDFWHWVKESEGVSGFPKIYLGYGKEDRFSYGQKLIAEILPPDHVIVIDGGHNWQTWKTLWDMILDKITSKRQNIHAELVLN